MANSCARRARWPAKAPSPRSPAAPPAASSTRSSPPPKRGKRRPEPSSGLAVRLYVHRRRRRIDDVGMLELAHALGNIEAGVERARLEPLDRLVPALAGVFQ